jgi:hypothetical protein
VIVVVEVLTLITTFLKKFKYQKNHRRVQVEIVVDGPTPAVVFVN